MRLNKFQISLRGFYGVYNFGDDLIVYSVLKFYESRLNFNAQKVDFYLSSKRDSLNKLKFDTRFEFKSDMGISDVYLPVTSKLKSWGVPKFMRIIAGAFALLLFVVSILIYKLTKARIFFPSYIDHYRKLDLIHFIGGGYFMDRWSNWLYEQYLTVCCAKLINPQIRIIGTGIGVGPIKKALNRRVLKKLLAKFSFVAVREEETKKNLDILGINCLCLGDDVLLLYNLLIDLRMKSKKEGKQLFAVAINIKDYPDFNYDKYGIEILTFLARIRSKLPVNVEFYCFGISPGPDDLTLISDLVKKYRISDCEILVPYEIGIDCFLSHISRCDFGVGSAYHFTTLMLLCSIPVVSVVSGEYYCQKVKGISDLFSAKSVYEIGQVKSDLLVSEFERSRLPRDLGNSNKIMSLYEQMNDRYYEEISKVLIGRN
ncbi:MAG: polysaccharide pyruvyl transferase family protein [Candidatus Omnitrophota bacterium]